MAATNKKLAARGLKPAAELGERYPHGVRMRYIGGCRCTECRRANREYEAARKVARAEGDWNGIVSAAKARKHMLWLSEQGVGRRSVQAVTDIADSILHEIRSGTRTRIRARTERLILAVTVEMAADNALVPAGPTWRLINKILKKGYTQSQIALGIGKKTPQLQLNRDQVTVRNAYKVAQYYSKCVAEGFPESNFAQDPALPKNTYSPRPGVLIHRMPE